MSAVNYKSTKPLPRRITLCSGASDTPAADHNVAGSCWNHLPFEAEDYFRLLRITNAWKEKMNPDSLTYVHAMAENIAASKILIDGRNADYQSYFPSTAEKDVSNDIVNASFYGFFCMAKHLTNSPLIQQFPIQYQNLFSTMASTCNSIPSYDPSTGITWKKGYKFYELYLSGERFTVPYDDWILSNKYN